MTQLVLPNTIDAGTEIVASEHQQNYDAIKTVINGQLEGGSGVAGNFKADGITARELVDALLIRGMPTNSQNMHEGVVGAGDLKVTPGAGLVLNYAAGTAWVQDDSGVLAVGALIPVTIVGSSVSIPANASGNPRIDQIILTMSGHGTGSVSVLQGTPTVGATLANRTGAAALPNDSIRLADVLMPNGFAGPFVQATHIRDRRLFSAGYLGFRSRNSNLSQSGTADVADAEIAQRFESDGSTPIAVAFFASITSNTSTSNYSVGLQIDGATVATCLAASGGGVGVGVAIAVLAVTVPAAGSHTLTAFQAAGAQTLTFQASSPFATLAMELPRSLMTTNDGA